MSFINASLQYMKASDGVALYYQKWIPEHPKGIIVFIHGLADHSGRYNKFTQYFAHKGWGVALFDLRGHGQSGGKRTHINRFYDNLYDMAQFIEFVRRGNEDVPMYLAGHSFGGQLVLNFVVKYAKSIRGVIALSPHIVMKLDIPEWKLKLGKHLVKLFPTYRLKCNVAPEDLSHDTDVVERYRTDPNIGRTITLRCGLEIMKNAELVMALAGRLHLPTLLMHGSEDKICDVDATKKFFMRIPVYNKELKIYQGYYHELLNESGCENVFKDIESWLDAQVEAENRIASSRNKRGESYEELQAS